MTPPSEKLYSALTQAKQEAQMANGPWGKREILAVFDSFLGEFAKGLAKERKRANLVPEADQVYALYPRKINPEDAKIAITKALKKRELAYLLDKTNQFAEAVNSWPSSYRYGKDGRDLCPYGSSWFNSGGYDSDVKEWKRFGARNAAPHQHVSPPEPVGWQEAFPDFTDRDKAWTALQPAQQAYIVANMATAATFTALPLAVEESERLRKA
jgi:hypothetical protein